jgi:TolB protein
MAYIATNSEGVDALFIMPVDGGEAMPITSSKRAYVTVWGQDGKHIYYMAYDENNVGHIWETSLEDGASKQITNMAWEVTGDITPDGKHLLVHAAAGNQKGFKIWKIGLEGQESVRLTSDTDDRTADVSPVCSPDGNWVVFSSNREGKGDLFVVSMDGKELHRLTSAKGIESQPVWTPDSKYIIFRGENSETDLKAINMASL